MTDAVVEPAVEPAVEPIVEPAKEPVVEPKAVEPVVVDPDPDPAPQAPWGDDWREKLAGDDEKALKRLGRFSDPAALYKSYQEAENKIKEGIKPIERPGLDDVDAMKEYRKQAGIPEEFKSYQEAIKLPDNIEVGEEDQTIIETFAKRFHAEGYTPDALGSAVDEYFKIQEEVSNAQAEADSEFKTKTRAELQELWGGDYKPNLNAMKQYLGEGELFDKIMNGRLADGTLIGNSPEVISMFVSKALEANPAATIVPAGPDHAKNVSERIKEIKKVMREDRAAYFSDKDMQAEYQQLLEAEDKLSAG